MNSFSGTLVTQIVNKCLNGCLIFSICYSWFHKNKVYVYKTWKGGKLQKVDNGGNL